MSQSNKRLIWRFCVTLAFIYPFFSFFPLKAQVISPNPLPSPQKSTYTSQKLQVGFAGDPPAVIRSETGKLSGINVAIWAELAKKLNLDYEVVAYPSVPDMLDNLAEGKIDVAFGVNVTPERIAQFDFTQSLEHDDLKLLLPAAPATLWGIIKPFLGWAFISSIGGIVLCLFIVGNLLWWAERNHNIEQFSHNYYKGVSEGMWCALATFTTVGYGDRYPQTHLGRMIAGGWGIISLVIVTSLTAGIATTLAVAFSAQPSQKFNRPEDLKNARLAVVSGSLAQKWAQYYQARITPVNNLAEGITLLEKERVDGVVYSGLFLEYYLQQNPHTPETLANFTIGKETYNIVLSPNHPLTGKLNQQLVEVEMYLKFQKISDTWFQVKDFD